MQSQKDIPLKHILVPLDGSNSSFEAAKYATKIAKLAGAKMIFIHAIVNPQYLEYKSAGILTGQYLDEAKRHAEMWYMNAGDYASKQGVSFSTETILTLDSTTDSIVEFAEKKKVDLIVIGTHGRTGVKRLLLGSVASGVVSHAKCPVLVVR